MFPFRFTYRRPTKLSSFDRESRVKITDKLKSTDVEIEVANEELIQFYVPFIRFVWNWNIMAPINSGRVTIQKKYDGNKICYSVSIVRFLILMPSFIAIAIFNGMPLHLMFFMVGMILIGLIISWIRHKIFFDKLVSLL